MAKKDQQPDRRRFEEENRKPWTKEERETYEALRTRLAPLVRDLTTPAKEEKKKDPLAVLLGL